MSQLHEQSPITTLPSAEELRLMTGIPEVPGIGGTVLNRMVTTDYVNEQIAGLEDQFTQPVESASSDWVADYEQYVAENPEEAQAAVARVERDADSALMRRVLAQRDAAKVAEHHQREELTRQQLLFETEKTEKDEEDSEAA